MAKGGADGSRRFGGAQFALQPGGGGPGACSASGHARESPHERGIRGWQCVLSWSTQSTGPTKNQTRRVGASVMVGARPGELQWPALAGGSWRGGAGGPQKPGAQSFRRRKREPSSFHCAGPRRRAESNGARRRPFSMAGGWKEGPLRAFPRIGTNPGRWAGGRERACTTEGMADLAAWRGNLRAGNRKFPSFRRRFDFIRGRGPSGFYGHHPGIDSLGDRERLPAGPGSPEGRQEATRSWRCGSLTLSGTEVFWGGRRRPSVLPFVVEQLQSPGPQAGSEGLERFCLVGDSRRTSAVWRSFSQGAKLGLISRPWKGEVGCARFALEWGTRHGPGPAFGLISSTFRLGTILKWIGRGAAFSGAERYCADFP